MLSKDVRLHGKVIKSYIPTFFSIGFGIGSIVVGIKMLLGTDDPYFNEAPLSVLAAFFVFTFILIPVALGCFCGYSAYPQLKEIAKKYNLSIDKLVILHTEKSYRLHDLKRKKSKQLEYLIDREL